MKIEAIIDQPVIPTDWFDLRPVRKWDQGLIELYGGDARVARMTTSIPHPLPPGAAADFVKRSMSEDRTEDVWVLDGSRSNGAELMGLISLDRLDRGQSEIGYWVAPAFWNEGVAKAAVQALVEANPQKCTAIFASVFQDNPASARVLTQCGFEYLGDAESFSVARDTTVATWTYLKKLG